MSEKLPHFHTSTTFRNALIYGFGNFYNNFHTSTTSTKLPHFWRQCITVLYYICGSCGSKYTYTHERKIKNHYRGRYVENHFHTSTTFKNTLIYGFSNHKFVEVRNFHTSTTFNNAVIHCFQNFMKTSTYLKTVRNRVILWGGMYYLW